MLSTKGRYAARVLVYMALQPTEEPIRKQRIAEAEGVSEDYVEQILLRLKQRRIVSSVRGARGGFHLSVDVDKTSIAQVVEAVEGPLDVAGCRGENCDRANTCVTRAVWEEAGQAVRKVLEGVTIGALAARARQIQAQNTGNYVI